MGIVGSSDLNPEPLLSDLPSDLMGSQDSKQDTRRFLETEVINLSIRCLGLSMGMRPQVHLQEGQMRRQENVWDLTLERIP